MSRTRIIPLLLSLALLAGCGGREAGPALTAEERTQLYKTAIENARDAETNEAMPVLTDGDGEQLTLYLDLLGLNADDMEAFALSASLMNVRAYGIAAVYPADGRETAVKEGLEGFIDRQMQSFEQYLADQYDVASKARLEILTDGTVLLVMCQDQDTVYDAIRETIEGA